MANETDPNTATRPSERVVYVCYPKEQDLRDGMALVGLGWTTDEARADARRPNQPANDVIRITVKRVEKAPNWVKHHLTAWLLERAHDGRLVREVEQRAYHRLGNDPWIYTRQKTVIRFQVLRRSRRPAA